MLQVHSVRFLIHSQSMTKFGFLLIVMLLSSSSFAQDLRLPRIFSDHMVLQRDVEIRFWGWGTPGDITTISIGETEAETVVNRDGYWEAYFPKQKAGGPFTVTVSSSNDELTIDDIYFGDVWIAGGQSNMEWQVGANIDNMEAEIADSDYPEIRFFRVEKKISPFPLKDLDSGDWKPANSETVKNFSAVAWFFAKRNHFEQGVPVGIIDNNWGGTPAQSWAPAQRLLSVPGYEESSAKVLDPSINWENKFEENDQNNIIKYQRVEDLTEFLSFGVHTMEADDSDWEEVTLPNEQPFHEFVWLRKTFDVDQIADARLSLGNPGKFTVVLLNGERIYNKGWQDDPEITEIDKSLIRKGKNLIAIRTVEDWDNRVFIGKRDEFWIEVGNERTNLEGSWKFSNTIEPPLPEATRYEHEPGMLFNSMINPVAGYSLKGAIWYQGESNVGAYQYYNVLFESMIEEWRVAWNQGDFPFLFAQLANFQNKQDKPYDSYWARLRESQTQTLSLSNTGMATIIDIGDAEDIHPRNKQDVGYRLWKSAKKVAFGKNVVHSGPMYKGHITNGSNIELSFDFIGEGFVLQGADKPLGFEIAGEDKTFYWADAKIEENKIVVSSELVSNPVAVRYAWADNPDVSLYNSEGLPAVPFRTDNWKLKY